MTTKKSLRDTIAGIRKGRSLTVKANRNVAAVTAHRVFGKGGYSVSKHSKTLTIVKRHA
jgi:hypothetical protein